VEPFTIQCTTCKARLIVKDESVIGDILACPKCHSMVQVVPPVGWKRPDGDSWVDLTGKEAAAAPAEVAPAAARVARKPAPQKAAALIPPALPLRGAPELVAASPAVDPAAGAARGGLGDRETANAPVRWKSEWTLLGGGLVGGIVLGTAVWLAVATLSPEPEIAGHTPATDLETIDRAPGAPAAEAAAPPTPSASASPNLEPAPPESAPQEATRAAPATKPSVPAAEVLDREPVRASKPPLVEAPAETEAAQPAEEPRPALKLEPVAPAIVAGGAASDAAAGALPTTPSAADVPSEEPPPVVDNVADAPAAGEARPPSSLSREQVQRRLETSLAAVEFVDVPLGQFAIFIADVTGVPVTLDETALSRLGMGRGTKLSLTLRGTTAGQALSAATERAGLTYVVGDDGQIVVTARKR
jgi:hypothetical protein